MRHDKCFLTVQCFRMETLMSRGPGKIERAITEIFQSNGGWSFTTEDLIDLVYPGVPPQKKHRVSLIRAAKRVVKRLGSWSWFVSGGVGGTLVFFNLYDVASYGSARIKADHFGNYYRSKDPQAKRYPWMVTTDDDVRRRLQPGGDHHHCIVHGGVWWGHVQMNIAERDKDASPAARKMFEDRNRFLVGLGLTPEPLPEFLLDITA